jgi:hypothetical protein
MHSSSHYQNRNQFRPRQLAIVIECMMLFAVCSAGAFPAREVLGQSKTERAENSPLCTRDNALEMIKQQVGLTRTFDNSIRRITVLVRAADLLWSYEQKRARAVFTEAFELATEKEKENEAKAPKSIILRLRIQDQRYVVIRAVAKRDPAWARELTRETVKSQTHGREPSPARDSFNNRLTAERLLHAANEMISTDINAALDFARVSLNFAATSSLIHFLYRLAGVDQQGADQFYAHALAVYGDKPLREFLYLQAYPFAWRETLNTPVVPNYVVPANFVFNQSLQRRFVEVLLRRAQQALEAPLDERDTYRSSNVALLPGTAHLLQGLITLEPQVRVSLPDLLPALTEAREKVLVSLSVETQKLFLQPGREVSTTPVQTFDQKIESALKRPDKHERDQLIVTAVFGSEKENLADVVKAIDSITDSELRAHALEWLYFQRAITAIANKQFDEAERLTTKVEGRQRAYLHTEIAKALLRLGRSDTTTRAQQVLDEAIAEAKKGGVSIFAARTLLTASNLYAKIDRSQSIAILADAINCINRIDNPDFSDDPALEKALERKGSGGRYEGEYEFRFYMPGLDPESAFREMAKIDFDSALSQSPTLTDKFQRAMSTLALAETCLPRI